MTERQNRQLAQETLDQMQRTASNMEETELILHNMADEALEGQEAVDLHKQASRISDKARAIQSDVDTMTAALGDHGEPRTDLCQTLLLHLAHGVRSP